MAGFALRRAPYDRLRYSDLQHRKPKTMLANDITSRPHDGVRETAQTPWLVFEELNERIDSATQERLLAMILRNEAMRRINRLFTTSPS
jgi:hypothetical protein